MPSSTPSSPTSGGISLDFSGNNIFDICGNLLSDLSLNLPPPIVTISEQTIIDQPGLEIIKTKGYDISGNTEQTVTFISTEP